VEVVSKRKRAQPSLIYNDLRDANIRHSPTQFFLSKFTLIMVHI
jgi:hypothetical protein